MFYNFNLSNIKVCKAEVYGPTKVIGKEEDIGHVTKLKFALVPGICHSGSLHSGHYTAFTRDDLCGGWLHFMIFSGSTIMKPLVI